MRKSLIIAAVTSTLFLSGCATLNELQNDFAYKRGTNVSQEQIKSFTVTKTTKNEVLALLGEPQKIQNNTIEYHYQQINHLSGGVDQTIKFVFNKKDLLVDIKKVEGSHFGNALTSN